MVHCWPKYVALCFAGRHDDCGQPWNWRKRLNGIRRHGIRRGRGCVYLRH